MITVCVSKPNKNNTRKQNNNISITIQELDTVMTKLEALAI